ncbi:hypothetical protein GCM10023189_12490 [Nibrella saemangeumensis]|uniref:DUF2382 domain-containing protein n=1 Tax=Nibrella saemangeumensis TaxID=1084526 RepID=A0ABP8MKN2_9BACT
MAQTVVGIFDNASDAQHAVEKLVDKGYNRSDIDMSAQSDSSYSGGTNYSGTSDYSDSTSGIPDRHRNTSGTWGEEVADDTKDTIDHTGDHFRDRHKNTSGTWGEEVADDTKDVGSGIGDFFRSLFGGSDDNDDYKKYNEVGRRGCVVAVHVSSMDEAERVADILDDCGAVNVDERAGQYWSGSTSGSDMTTGSGYTAGSGMTTNAFADTDVTNRDFDRTNRDSDHTDRSIPIIEEQMNVGKREVETGGARIRSRIVERPVEENLRLRTEHVHVERNPVDRPTSESDLNTFKEEQIELTERAEVPVVNKEARVVEEVRLTKDVEERQETVRDTVRKTEVDVDQIPGKDTRWTDDANRTTDSYRSGDTYNTGTSDDTFRSDDITKRDDTYRDDTNRRTDNF